MLRNNLLVGPGGLKLPPFADSEGNHRVDWSTFVLASRHDYRLTPAAQSAMKASVMAPLPAALRPQAEYVHPLGLLPVPGGPLTPGALQSVPN